VTACTDAAQKYIKILQSGYAPPFRTGSKILKKLTLSSCEEFNRKAFALLDLVKHMEGPYKLADLKLITQDNEYATLCPIGIVAWAQKEHTQLVTDHEWTALAAKLPESNLAETHLAKATYASKVKEGGIRKCYRCGSENHLRPECPHPPKEGENRGPPPSTKSEEQRIRKPLASWKYIQPHNLTKTYPDEDKKEWKFCKKCTCRATNKKGFFQLSHFDADHKDGFRPQANLSHVEDPNANVPAAPPLVTTKEPDEKEDEDEIVFIDSSWCCIVPNAPDSEITWIVPHAPNDDKSLSTWCRVTDEDEVYYENSAWCCVVPNAPNSDTTFTHVPAAMHDDAKIVHDANILHK
jgi:hypothetical protein